MTLNQEIEKLFGHQLDSFEGLNSEIYLRIDEAELQKAIIFMDKNGFELISLFCVEDLPKKGLPSSMPSKKKGSNKF